MANFFTNLFVRNKSKESPEALIHKALDGVLERGNFDLGFEIETKEEGLYVNFSGPDAKILTEKEGLVLDGFQIFLKRFLQNKYSDQAVDVVVDCEGFLEASAQELRDLADKLKTVVLEKGQPSYVRALPPRDRKTIHRHLAQDARVRSQSVGEGFCKKIRISPANGATAPQKREPRQNKDLSG